MRRLGRLFRRFTDARFVRWCLLTAFSFTLNVGLSVGLHEVLGVSEEASFLVALATVFVANFLIMRHYVYSATAAGGGRQLAAYTVSSLGFRGAEYAAFLVIHTWLGGHYLPTLLGILVVSSLTKYFYYGLVVFRGGAAGDSAEDHDHPGAPVASAPDLSRPHPQR